MNPAIRRRATPEHAFGDELGPILKRVFAARGICSDAELDLSLKTLIPSDQLSGINEATQLLAEAIATDKRILIVADFDADGATSCAVAVRGLRNMGAVTVDYIVPNRFAYGYGLTPEIVNIALREQPDLIITVDNGISSMAGVKAARDAGVDVLITDHHLPGQDIPNANAIVNPNLHDDSFGSKNLAGVGVIFYVLLALRMELRTRHWFGDNKIKEPNLAELLDLVALGTVADVVPLDRNNRILVEQGLRRIRAGKTIAGIAALIEVAGANQRRLSSSDLAFALGPRLNSAGRLADMGLGIECLLSDSESKARQLAERLQQLNLERREIEREMKGQATSFLSSLTIDSGELPAGLCFFDASWHQGVVGIVASRIKDQCHRPVIAFAPDESGQLKGSGRSIPGLHLRDLLDLLATRHPNLLSKFGGHAMAAGLSIEAQDFAEFSAIFADLAAQSVNETMLQKTLETDGALDDQYLDISLAEKLRTAAPWGQAFPAPLFDDDFDIVSRRVVGEYHLKLKLRRAQGQRVVDGIAFNAGQQAWASDANRIRAVYRLDVNEYRDARSVQLLIEHASEI
ncbi:MAG: single-stranded-DNA-specific exonuclease RecJ [Pseudomonadota bacterium]